MLCNGPVNGNTHINNKEKHPSKYKDQQTLMYVPCSDLVGRLPISNRDDRCTS